MFGRGKKTGEVGTNKEADREIILWITHEILQAIQNDTNTDDLSNLKIHSSEPIQGYSMKDAYWVWNSITLSSICTKFITAYNSKLFSKSKKYVLPYFKALKTILDTQNDEYESEKLEALLNAYRDLAKSQIANRRALLNLTTDTGSKLKTAMNQQLTQMEKMLQHKETEKNIKLAKTKFFELLDKILANLQENYSWAIINGFGKDLDELIGCFEKAYLSGAKLTVTHPDYSCVYVTENCLLRAYPVLKQLSETITKKKIEDSRFENLNKFLEGAYDGLEKDENSMYKAGSDVPDNFDSDLGEVKLLLLR